MEVRPLHRPPQEQTPTSDFDIKKLDKRLADPDLATDITEGLLRVAAQVDSEAEDGEK